MERGTAQRNKGPHSWSVYKNLCREVKHEIRTAEKIFIAEQVVNNKNNSNCLWKAIRLCIPKKSPSQRNYSNDEKLLLMSSIISFPVWERVQSIKLLS